jgi:hypothetical protein
MCLSACIYCESVEVNIFDGTSIDCAVPGYVAGTRTTVLTSQRVCIKFGMFTIKFDSTQIKSRTSINFGYAARFSNAVGRLVKRRVHEGYRSEENGCRALTWDMGGGAQARKSIQ